MLTWGSVDAAVWMPALSCLVSPRGPPKPGPLQRVFVWQCWCHAHSEPSGSMLSPENATSHSQPGFADGQVAIGSRGGTPSLRWAQRCHVTVLTGLVGHGKEKRKPSDHCGQRSERGPGTGAWTVPTGAGAAYLQGTGTWRSRACSFSDCLSPCDSSRDMRETLGVPICSSFVFGRKSPSTGLQSACQIRALIETRCSLGSGGTVGRSEAGAGPGTMGRTQAARRSVPVRPPSPPGGNGRQGPACAELPR